MRDFCKGFGILKISDLEKVLEKLKSEKDPIDKLLYKLRTIFTAYGCDDQDRVYSRNGNIEDDFIFQQEDEFKLEVFDLNLVLSQFTEDYQRSYSAVIKDKTTGNVLCDTLNEIYTSGEWENTIDKLFKSSITAIKTAVTYNDNKIDGISFVRNSNLNYIIERLFNDSIPCIKLQFCFGINTIVVGNKLIISKEHIDKYRTKYQIYDVNPECGLVLDMDVVRDVDDEFIKRPFINLFKPGNWQNYILDYSKTMEEENIEENKRMVK